LKEDLKKKANEGLKKKDEDKTEEDIEAIAEETA